MRRIIGTRAFGQSGRARVLLRLALYGSALFAGVPLAFSHVMTRTYRLDTPGRPSPGYEQLALASDGLELRAWLARGSADKPAAIVVHGLGDSLESYLEHAALFRKRGGSVLLVDLRGHGGSQGTHTTLGARESSDVRAGMQYLRDKGLARSGILLMGHSMGSVAVLLAASDQADVRGVIVEAPYDTYRNTIAHHAKLLYGLPAWLPIIPLSIRAAEWRAGFSADAADAVQAARRVRAPLLAIADGGDPRMTEPIVRRVFDAHPGPKRLWVAPGVDHVGAFLLPEWAVRVNGFLDENGL